MIIRRTNGRTPPLATVGLVVVLLILAFNYWTLTTQNRDLQQTVDNLQAVIKIGNVKQDQSDKTNTALQDTVHEVKEVAARLRLKVDQEHKTAELAQDTIKSKDYEITNLKHQIIKLNQQLKNVSHFVEDRDYDLGKLKYDYTRVMQHKDDAEKAISDRDATIALLRSKLEQKENELSVVKREGRASSKPSVVPGIMNIPNLSQKPVYKQFGSLDYVPRGSVSAVDKGMKGIHFHNQPILPRDSPDARRAKPRYSVALQEENASQAQHTQKDELNKLILPKDLVDPAHLQSNVIARPPQKVSSAGPPVVQKSAGRDVDFKHPNVESVQVLPPQPPENLDNAIDEIEKVVDDPSEDQDEEGKEIKQDLENNHNGDYQQPDYNHPNDQDKRDAEKLPFRDPSAHREPGGIGAGEILRAPGPDRLRGDDAGEDLDDQGIENFIENVDSVRNLGHVRRN